ncbi:Elicitor-like transglutaminase, partial [Globisporangium polare]
MVATTSFAALAAVAALASSSSFVTGAPIENLPVTIMDDREPLTHFHPAFGAQVPNKVIEYRIERVEEPLSKEEANVIFPSNDSSDASATVSPARMRQLEATNGDIQRLESYFGTTMERNVDTLKQWSTSSSDSAPWPSSYWPIYADGINYRWNGNQPSAAEKYANAYGKNAKTFMSAVSQSTGILSQSKRKSCKKTSECDSLKDGSICGIRQGETKGYCIPGWFGICHAWSPAAIMEPEPKCAVKKGSVTFQPFDIKALLTQIYDGAAVETVFTGARFNGPDFPENKDEYGRYNDAARRDLGPGFFHIAIHNIMGKFKKSFVVDVTAGAEVWNQPVRDYQVVESKMLTLEEGAQQFFNTLTYPFNKEAAKLMYVNTLFRWIVESGEDGPLVSTGKVDSYTASANYKYVLELDSDNNILGGEWVKESQSEHPDFLWFPGSRPAASTVTSVGLSYADVQQLLDASVKCVDLNPTPAPSPSTRAPTPTPTTVAPTPTPTTVAPTPTPTTAAPTPTPTTVAPTPTPTTAAPTPTPTTVAPTPTPTTAAPTPTPTTIAPTPTPTTVAPTPAPVPTTVAPVPTTVAPVPTTVAPVPTTVAPVPTTDAPVPTTVAPVPTTVAPVPTTVAPVPTTVAPVPTTVAPVPTTVAPVPTTDAPVPTTVAPVPTTDAPVPT